MSLFRYLEKKSIESNHDDSRVRSYWERRCRQPRLSVSRRRRRDFARKKWTKPTTEKRAFFSLIRRSWNFIAMKEIERARCNPSRFRLENDSVAEAAAFSLSIDPTAALDGRHHFRLRIRAIRGLAHFSEPSVFDYYADRLVDLWDFLVFSIDFFSLNRQSLLFFIYYYYFFNS